MDYYNLIRNILYKYNDIGCRKLGYISDKPIYLVKYYGYEFYYYDGKLYDLDELVVRYIDTKRYPINNNQIQLIQNELDKKDETIKNLQQQLQEHQHGINEVFQSAEEEVRIQRLVDEQNKAVEESKEVDEAVREMNETEFKVACAEMEDKVECKKENVENKEIESEEVKSLLEGKVVPDDGEDVKVNSNACVVCLENMKTCLIKPCNHLCMCIGCSRLQEINIRKSEFSCPLCRKNVTSIERIYLS